MNENKLLITQEQFKNMETYFVEHNYASPHPRDISRDVRFTDFKNVKDIILKNGSFNLMIFNDYENKESTLVTYIEVDKFYEKDREEFTFDSVDQFCTKLSFYKKYLSKENGTIQVIDWIINACTDVVR